MQRFFYRGLTSESLRFYSSLMFILARPKKFRTAFFLRLENSTCLYANWLLHETSLLERSLVVLTMYFRNIIYFLNVSRYYSKLNYCISIVHLKKVFLSYRLYLQIEIMGQMEFSGHKRIFSCLYFRGGLSLAWQESRMKL